jgi:hypothetical protein
MALAIIGAVGLFAIGLKPVIEATPAFAQSKQVHKISICNENGIDCARIVSLGRLGIYGS